MAVAYNKVILAGNLTRDPQTKFLANERAVANFGLAVNRRYRGADGESKEEVTFVDCEAWGRTAELVGQYLTKGRACLVEGRLRLDQWENREGQKRNKLMVVVEQVQFLPGRGDGPGPRDDANAEDAGGAPSAPAPAAGDEDDPPF